MRTLVIGLDGASLPLIEQWAASGDLPHLAALMQRGVYGELRSVMPVLSSAAWVSFMTGMNPGKHGIYDFVQRDLTTYKRRTVRAGAMLPVPTLWKILSKAQQKVAVTNVPMTYPVETVNGILVSGLGTPEYRPFTYPVDVEQKLRSSGYRVNKQVHFAPGNEQAFLDEVYAITKIQADAALEILRNGEWDFFMHVIRDPDEMAHFFWAASDPSHPNHTAALSTRFGNALHDYYCFVDEFVGKFVASAGENVNIIVVSDHGSGPLYKDVSLNEWLHQAGFLALKATPPPTASAKHLLAQAGITRQRISQTLRRMKLGRIERWIKDMLGTRIEMLAESQRQELSECVDWSKTKAYSFGYHGQIYINLVEREAQGIIPIAEYEKVCNEIVAALTELRDPDDGELVVSATYRKEELFHGSYVDLAPDITVIMRNLAYVTRQGYEFGATRNELFASPHTHESGSHREMGIIIAAGPSFAALGRNRESVNLIDVAPTILHLHQCPAPDMIDGRVLFEWLNEHEHQPVTAEHRLNTADSTDRSDGVNTTASSAEWSDEDEATLMQQLRNLGYVE